MFFVYLQNHRSTKYNNYEMFDMLVIVAVSFRPSFEHQIYGSVSQYLDNYFNGLIYILPILTDVK